MRLFLPLLLFALVACSHKPVQTQTKSSDPYFAGKAYLDGLVNEAKIVVKARTGNDLKFTNATPEQMYAGMDHAFKTLFIRYLEKATPEQAKDQMMALVNHDVQPSSQTDFKLVATANEVRAITEKQFRGMFLSQFQNAKVVEKKK